MSLKEFNKYIMNANVNNSRVYFFDALKEFILYTIKAKIEIKNEFKESFIKGDERSIKGLEQLLPLVIINAKKQKWIDILCFIMKYINSYINQDKYLYFMGLRMKLLTIEENLLQTPNLTNIKAKTEYQNKKKELFTTLKQSLPSLMLVEFDSFCLNIQTNNTKVNNIIHK